MTEIRVSTGLSMTVNRSNNSSSDDLASAAGFMASLQQASTTEIGTRQNGGSDRPANSQQSVRSTNQTTANTQSTANSESAQDKTAIIDEAAEQGCAVSADGSVQTPQEDKIQFDSFGNEDLKAALRAALNADGGMESAELTEQAKKFLEALATDEDLQQQLKDMLTQALHEAFEKLKDPKQQEEEFTKKVLRFLEKFMEKMNRKDDKKTALEDGNPDGSVQGLLMQMLKNMIQQMQGVQTKNTTIAYAQALESQVITPVDTVAALNTDMFESEDVLNRIVIPEPAEETAEIPQRVDSFVNNLENAEDMPKAAEENAAESVSPVENQVYEQIAENVYTEVADKFYQAVGEKTETAAVAGEKATVTRIEDRFTKKVRSSEEELEELKRLFGMEPKKRKKLDTTEETEEETENEQQTNSGTNNRKSEGAEDISRFSEKLGVETVAAADKTQAPAIARSFTLGEAGVKQILSQVVTETLNNLPQEQGEKTFMMTLNPETLGRISVKMVENAGKINIVVTAHNKDTAELLASRLEGMESMMKQSGTQLEKCQVVYEPEQNDRAGQQNYEGSSKNPYFRQQDEKNTDEDGRFAEALNQQAV